MKIESGGFLKIGLYSPYSNSILGGGERYFLSVAECLLKLGHRVDLVFPGKILKSKRQKELKKSKFEKTFGLDLAKLNLISGPFGNNGSFFDRLRFTNQYDAFYYLTDGSFFISLSRRNITQFQIPFNNPSLINKLKLKFWPVKVANSFFTKEIIEKNWDTKIDFVHAGIVDIEKIRPQNKENIILNVGRFISRLNNKHCKCQDVLVKVFKKMCDEGLKGWRLVLIGKTDKGKDNEEYAENVKITAEGYPVEILFGASFEKLLSYYGKAKIYWHATGYGRDEDKNPEMMEHLGISTIEAMSAGAVPIVIKKGGQREIVSDKKNGLLWETEKELIIKTLKVMENFNLRKRLSENARKRASDFSKEKFCEMTKKIFGL